MHNWSAKKQYFTVKHMLQHNLHWRFIVKTDQFVCILLRFSYKTKQTNISNKQYLQIHQERSFALSYFFLVLFFCSSYTFKHILSIKYAIILTKPRR